MKLYKINLTMLLIFALLLMQLSIIGQIEDPKTPPFPDLSEGRGSGSKGGPNDKLSPDLKILLSQYDGSKGQDDNKNDVIFSDDQLKEVFGIDAQDKEPKVSLAVTVKSDADIEDLKKAGMKVYLRQGDSVYGEIDVKRLGRLARENSIVQISSVKDVKTPPVPRNPTPPTFPVSRSTSKGNGTTIEKKVPLANEFNKRNLTGKGVIVGVIDSGIDWTHPDFINADGTSRILAIWDFFDDSFVNSNGKIGTSPPKLDPKGDPLFGTIYTNAQINAALKKQGTVNTKDNNGHGTASAGTAAGNGRASGGKYVGVAPQADLIIVKAGDCGGIVGAYIYGAFWMIQTAKMLKKPIIINQSFGGHFSAHDGTESEEQLLNTLTGKGKPGVIFTVSAGNEGRNSMHATGRFGKKTATGGEWSRPISVTISNEKTGGRGTLLTGYFDSKDDWGIVVDAKSSTGLVDNNGKSLAFYVYKDKGQIKYYIDGRLAKPDWFDRFATSVIRASELGKVKDELVLGLPPGSYELWAYGTSENVVNGNFDFYIPAFQKAEFGEGTTKTGMVGTPGNATNVITVGAYNFRNDWVNNTNTQTSLNLPIGQISDYSSPGGIRPNDKVLKPDISSPASYTISPLSKDAGLKSATCEGRNMGSGGENYVTSNEKYIAWQGTSASSPFTAGVIALMLQKNKNLDAEQVKEIIKKTAKKGGNIGATPNPKWGNGMLNPEDAIQATPAVSKKRKPLRKKK